MAKRKNLLALAILSLLGERPMHPYEMAAVMRHREFSTFIKFNQSSLYLLTETLQREGLVKPVEIQREGRYPERTVYTITETGQAELHDWLRALIRQPMTEYSQFAVGLAFLGHLQPEEVVTLLQEHIKHIQEQISASHRAIDKALQFGVDRVFIIEDRYALTILEARRSFIQQLLEEINDGSLTESRDGRLTWKVRRPELGLMMEEEKTQEAPDDTQQTE